MLIDSASRTVDLDGYTHYLDFEGPAERPPLVCVHGLGGSHVNWIAVAPEFARDQHVFAPDLAGHGLTFPDGRHTDVDSNQALLNRFIQEVVGQPVVLMGNSMGGMISILQAARHPDSVVALALIDAAVPGPRDPRQLDREVLASFAGYALPGVGRAILARRRSRFTAEQQVEEVLSLCCVDTNRVPEDLRARSVELAERRRTVRGVDQAFLDSARSVLQMQTVRRPSYTAAMSSITAPTLLVQGDQDRLVPLEAARLAVATNPSWDLRVVEGVGHVPQIEAPQWTIDTYRGWGAPLGLTTTP